MEEDYCSFEVAKLLKEKGFPFIEHLYMYVDASNRFMTDHSACLTLSTEEYCKHFDELFTPTITHQMAMKWLRKVHNIHIAIDRGIEHYFAVLTKLKPYQDLTMKNDVFDTYEEAVDAALKYCLTKII